MIKNIIQLFIPNYKFNNIVDINESFFSGSQLIVLDLDNTLVFSETTETKKEVLNWLQSNISKKYNCVIVSNSRSFLKRSKYISNLFGCDVYISKHRKPSKGLFNEIKSKYSFENSKVFVIGDRVFSDVLFGNLNGAKTVLINPLDNKEYFIIKIIRFIENSLLSCLKLFGYN